MQARLLLEDGTIYTGQSFGSTGDQLGEVVFYTGVTGYQELMSDPSCCGNILTMTYPLIGTYGITRDDFESVRPFIHGLVVRQYEAVPSNWRTEYTLEEMMNEYDIPGISGIDTRMLTRKLRASGAMKGLITTSSAPVQELLERLQAFQPARDQVRRVSTQAVYRSSGHRERVVVIDYGVKNSIVRSLTMRGCDVTVVPYDTSAEQIRRLRPDGVLLSSGPGNPKDVPEAVAVVRELTGDIPMFGIGLGHLLFALACGADTTKLAFGHCGGNQPVKDVATSRCFITSQNHAYSVADSSIQGTQLEVTHINNNDGTIEGLRHLGAPAFSVQYSPEASTALSDTGNMFDAFLEMIRDWKTNHPQEPKQAQFAKTSKGELRYAER